MLILLPFKGRFLQIKRSMLIQLLGISLEIKPDPLFRK